MIEFIATVVCVALCIYVLKKWTGFPWNWAIPVGFLAGAALVMSVSWQMGELPPGQAGFDYSVYRWLGMSPLCLWIGCAVSWLVYKNRRNLIVSMIPAALGCIGAVWVLHAVPSFAEPEQPAPTAAEAAP